MEATVRAEGQDQADQLHSLYDWLADVEELRGRIGYQEKPPEPGTLGPLLDALSVALGPAGAATALATAVVGWLRTCRGTVRIKVTLSEHRSIELTAENVSRLDHGALRQQVADIAALLSSGAEGEQERENGNRNGETE